MHRRLSPVAILLALSGCEVLFGIKESSSGAGGNGGAPGSHVTSGEATSTSAMSSGSSGGGATSASSSGTASSSGATSTSAVSSTSASAASSSGITQPFCATQTGAYFCADFDEGGFGNWTDTKDIDPMLTGVVDGTDVKSEPGAFHVYAPSGLGSSCKSARLHESLDAGWSQVTVKLDYAGCPGLPQNGGAIDFLTLDCTVAGSTSGLVRWGLHPTGDQVAIYAEDGGKIGALDGGAPETDGGFTHVELDVTFGSSGTVQLTLDGTIVANGTFDIACPGGTTGIALGMLDCENANLACTVHIDNVVITGH